MSEDEKKPSSWSEYMAQHGIEEYATEEIAEILREYNAEDLIGTPLHHRLVEYVAGWVRSAKSPS